MQKHAQTERLPKRARTQLAEEVDQHWVQAPGWPLHGEAARWRGQLDEEISREREARGNEPPHWPGMPHLQCPKRGAYKMEVWVARNLSHTLPNMAPGYLDQVPQGALCHVGGSEGRVSHQTYFVASLWGFGLFCLWWQALKATSLQGGSPFGRNHSGAEIFN